MKINCLTYQKTKTLEAGKYADGQGLWLHKRSKETGNWVLRIYVHGRRREMGFGRWPDVSIAEARERAAEARRVVRDGDDPIALRQERKHRAKGLTVSEAIQSCFEARKAELKGDGIPGQWLSPLNNHVVPTLGRVRLQDVTCLTSALMGQFRVI